jgi:feruloyl esterase
MIDPAVDNGWHAPALSPGQLWYGYARGALLHNNTFTFGVGPAGDTPFVIGSDWIALTLRDPSYATRDFSNETGQGQDQWRKIDYTGPRSFASVLSKSQQTFRDLNPTDNPDLEAFRAAGGKIIHWHGLADNQIPAGGSVRYYESVVRRMGGYAATQGFYRFYLVPGMGHGLAADPSVRPPVPGGDTRPPFGANNGLLPLLRDWVENGKAPDSIEAVSPASQPPVRSRPWCLYPKRLKFLGGNSERAASFTCAE